MSDKKAKISLSGLTKGGQSNAFLSFRFSPDSEEMEEIMQDKPLEAQGLSESAPVSPKPTSGDVSPLKEYLIKEKHKWTNKWDKKSMSLDLDLKGKIRTAIEDKRKSILSNFIPEESGSIPPIPVSQSIPDNIGSMSFISESEDNSQSSSSSGNQGRGTENNPTSSSKKNRHNSSGNCSQATLEGDSASHSPERKSPYNDVEVGFEMTESQNLLEESLLLQLCEFFIPGENLNEHYGGLPTLYQPSSLITGLRMIPIERPSDNDLQDDSISQLNVPGVKSRTNSALAKDDVRVSVLIMDALKDSLEHCLTKYWFALLAANVLLPISGLLAAICWFVLGAFGTFIVGIGFMAPKDKNKRVSNPFVDLPKVPIYKEYRLPIKSQGWMTQMDGDYDFDNCTFRQTKLVFVRLDGYNLYLSYPHPKIRIPKRRLFNDPLLSSEVLFIQHKVYNISGAKISIVPDGLTERRVWNKKYPIEVTFSKWTVLTKVDPSPLTDVLLGVPLDLSSEAPNTTVNYNVNSAGISVNEHSETPKPNIKKEITKEDSGSKSIYLFSRCDREKEDWFRRFTAATKIGTEAYSLKSSPDYLTEYKEYMKKMCPTLNPVQIPFGEYDIVDTYCPPSDNKSTPSSSKKSTPDKDKPTTSKEPSIYSSDIEKILTISQSPVFLNAIVGRLFMDFLKSTYWKSEVTKLIDKKFFYMRKIRIIEEIHVKELEMGNSIPVIQKSSAPVLDNQGLWVDLDIVYEGSFCLTLETHVNFSRIIQNKDEAGDTKEPEARKSENGGKNTSTKNPPTFPEKVNEIIKKSHVFDPEADDSGESSEDEADIEFQAQAAHIPDIDPNSTQKSQSKFMKMGQGLANQLMKTDAAKKIVNNISATPIVVMVELKKCIGTLALNIPPPPNDRIWLGFRTNPEIQLEVTPKYGDRFVNFTSVSDYLKRKLTLEFQRVAVCPNMTDMTIPLMDFNLPK